MFFCGDDCTVLTSKSRMQDWSDKLVVVGESGVGKTSLILRYCGGVFQDGCKVCRTCRQISNVSQSSMLACHFWQSTIGVEFFWQKFAYKDYTYTLNMYETELEKTLSRSTNYDFFCSWDTAGQERFRAISSVYFRGTKACLLAFDLAVPASLDKAKHVRVDCFCGASFWSLADSPPCALIHHAVGC